MSDSVGGGATRHGSGRTALRWIIQLALTAVVTAFVLRRLGFTFGEVVALDLGRWRPDARWLGASVLTLAAGYAISGWLWARMVRELGGPRLRPWTAIRVYMVANLGRYIPGKVFQIAGLAWLARREGVSATTATAAAVVGQGVALLGATVVGLVALLGPDSRYQTVGWVGLGLGAVFIATTSIPGTARLLARLGRRVVGWGRDEAAAPSVPLRVRPGFGLRWTGWYAFNWGVYAAAFWLFFMGLEGWVPFWQVGPAFAAAYLVGYLVLFAPAGAGIRESALVALLLPVVPADAALALAVAARLWTTLVEIVPAAAMAAIHTRRDPSDSHSTA